MTTTTTPHRGSGSHMPCRFTTESGFEKECEHYRGHDGPHQPVNPLAKRPSHMDPNFFRSMKPCDQCDGRKH
jgi:hypothetical protein